MSVISVDARGQGFRIQQVAGNLFVCAEENGGCCCGHVEKGRAPVNKVLYESEWQDRGLRPHVHLTFVGCLGPCPVGNNAMLQLFGRSIWLKDLNDDRLIPLLFTYIEQSVRAGAAAEMSGELAAHVYDRYALPAGESAPVDFSGLDPVCMMSVDMDTAQWRSEVDGVAYGFCSPGCKRTFDKNPAAYLAPSTAQMRDPVASTANLVESAALGDGAGDSASKPGVTGSNAAVHNSLDQGEIMTKTFVVPNISCDHCVRSIKNELAEVSGVSMVNADAATKAVTVEWADPATWEQIKTALTEIDYPPQELIQL